MTVACLGSPPVLATHTHTQAAAASLSQKSTSKSLTVAHADWPAACEAASRPISARRVVYGPQGREEGGNSSTEWMRQRDKADSVQVHTNTPDGAGNRKWMQLKAFLSSR